MAAIVPRWVDWYPHCYLITSSAFFFINDKPARIKTLTKGAIVSLKQHAQDHLKIDASRVVMASQNELLDISSIKKGIVFVWATWSGTAQQAIKTLGKALTTVTDLGDLIVLIIDADTETAERFMLLAHAQSTGAGETFWISNGRILNTLSNYTEKELDKLCQYTNSLLS